MHLGETLVFHEPFHLRYTDVRRHLSASVVNVNTRGRLYPSVNDVVVEVGVVCLHPVHGFMPERPLRRDLAVNVDLDCLVVKDDKASAVRCPT